MTEREGDRQLEDGLQFLLGYLNFSEGKPDPRFQRTLGETYARLHVPGASAWPDVAARLRAHLHALHAAGAAAFRDIAQAEAALTLIFDRALAAYRAHHADLLFHLSDEELFQPFFVARVAEAVLANGPLRGEPDRLIAAVIKQLNDYVGHRPVAVLETRPRGEPYAHERVRPVPLYIEGAGVAPGPYHDLVAMALEILAGTDRAILAEACLELEQLEELAFDPRAYDHSHPVNRRPNYVFGEWDPHVIDLKGRYRRFVVRQLTLDAILARTREAANLPREEVLFEAGAVLAGTMLMAAGVRGSGPETYDSSVTLANLVPRIARYRDAFYSGLLKKVGGAHGARLRQEMEVTHQPFGGARQYLNQYLARHRAAQLQQRHLAMVLAEMGYPEASRRHAAQAPAASTRFLCELHIRLTSGLKLLEQGDLAGATKHVSEVEDLLHKGIACGALADPWNILGFGGLYPLFQSMEDSIHDSRNDELIAAVEQTFNIYGRLLAESAATGSRKLGKEVAANMRRLAAWWDKFAAYEVSEVRRVHGGEAVASAEHVATALQRWQERGNKPADLAFWRGHLEGFRSPKAYALVLDALLRKEDYRAAMGLLMHWLSQLDQVPLEDGEYSFHHLALRWMLGLCRSLQGRPDARLADGQPPELVVKFFDFLEANAEDYWGVPRLEMLGIPLEADQGAATEEEEEDVFSAAYEDVVYTDTTDDNVEMEVLDVGPQPEFNLEVEADRIEKHLRFLSTVARLWNIACRLTVSRGERGRAVPVVDAPRTKGTPAAGPLPAWLRKARENYQNLIALLDSIYEHQVPPPSGTYDSLVEFDRRRVIKDRLLHVIIATCLDTWLAVAALRSRQLLPRKKTSWKVTHMLLEEALWDGDAEAARQLVPAFLETFKNEPLLFTPLGQGGHPRLILRASRAQNILRGLAANLPRLGLLGETFLVVQAAHEMERRQQIQGPRITEFARLFQVAVQASAEAIIENAKAADPPVDEARLLVLLERFILPYLPLWREHSKTLRVATLEMVSNEAEWAALRDFVKRYGRDLFHVRFMTFGNLRGILHQGVGRYLEYLREQPDPLHPVRLIDDLDRVISRGEAERRLEIILQAVIENYDNYKDYNTTATQSDYGENLHILLDFLRLKASYERQAWYFRPLAHVHEVLARRLPSAATAWQEQFTRAAEPLAERHLKHLAHLERTHGVRLNTVRDRLEERFVKPLTLDRVCALIEPTMDAAGTPRADEALTLFEEHLRPCAATPTGVGLDVPQWLQRVEATIHQVRSSRSDIAGLAENLLQIPKKGLSLQELESQLIDIPGELSWNNLWSAIIAALGQIGLVE